MSKYWRVYCNTEQQFVYTWSDTTPTVCPTTSSDSIGTIKELPINYKRLEYSITPTEVNSNTYTLILEFEFPGTNEIKYVDSCKILTYINSGTYSLRLYDLTNSNVIAEKTGNNNTTSLLIDMGTLSNLPTNAALFEVQVKRDTGTDNPTSSYTLIKYHKKLPK
jgi:hypothetical protein